MRSAPTMASTAGSVNVGVRESVKRRRARGVGSVGIAELKSIRLFTQVPADRLQELADAASQQRVELRRLPYAAAARTLSPARIVAIPAAAIRELFDGDRTFARAVADELSRASHRTLAELKSLKMQRPWNGSLIGCCVPTPDRTAAASSGFPSASGRSPRGSA
jgi:CRP-like cAMP-binding protein